MIGTIDVEVQAKYPNLPLDPMQAFVGSPSSIRIRNVPKRIGDWCIRSVQFVAIYPDGAIKTAQCVLTGGVWVGTIEGTQTSGTSKNGYSIFASGTDENGNLVNDYCLGKGNVEILKTDGTIDPTAPSYYVHLLSAQSESPKEGDLWQTSGTYYIWQDGQAWPIGDDSGLIGELSTELSNKADVSSLTAYALESELSDYALSNDVTSALSAKQDALSAVQLNAINFAVTNGQTWVKYVDNSTNFLYISGELTNSSIPNIEDVAEIVIGNAVTSIGDYAFYYCSWLASATIPNSVKSIGNYAFCECIRLANVTIPDSVTSIGTHAFAGCLLSSQFTIPDSVTSIGENAFQHCNGLVNVSISRNVTSIGEDAFYDSNNLQNVTFKGKTLSQVESMYYYPWGISNTSVIKTWNDASQEWVSAQGYALSSELNYQIVTPQGNTLVNRAVNKIQASSNSSYTLPAFIQGYARDFIIRVELSGSTVPTLTFNAPSGETVTYETDDDAFPTPDEIGTWLYSFTETDAHKFTVSVKKIAVVTQGGN